MKWVHLIRRSCLIAFVALAACTGSAPDRQVAERGFVGTVAVPVASAAQGTAPKASVPDGVEVFDVDASAAWPGNQGEVAVAIDGADPDRIVAVSMNGVGNGMLTMASSDGGRTWSQSIVPFSSDASWHADPMVVFATDGSVVLTHIPVLSGTGPLGIEVTRSTDGGESWSPNQRISTNRGRDDKLAIVVDDAPDSPWFGRIHVAWKFPAGQILLSRSDDHGVTWEVPRQIAPSTVSGLDLAVADDGTVYLAANRTQLARWSMVVLRSDDGGDTWVGPTSVATVGAGWYIRVPAVCQREPLVHASLTVDRSPGPDQGTVVLTWGDNGGGQRCSQACTTTATCTSDIFVSRSVDRGETWSTPTVLAGPERAPGEQFHQWARFDADGALYAAYKDTRDDPAGLATHVYLNRSTDAGRSWEPAIPLSSASGVSNAGFGYGDYHMLDVAGGRVVAVWGDYRRSTTDGDMWAGVAEFAQETRTVVSALVPAAANAPGAVGTRWRSDLELLNTGEVAATVVASLLVEGQPNPAPRTAELEVPPGQALRVPNALDALFAFDGVAAVGLEAPPEVLALSRTWTEGTDGGGYGQLIPVLDEAAALAPGEEARLLQLSHSADRSVGFRTNLGLVSLAAEPLEVEVELGDGTGATLGALTRTLEPGELRQIGRVFEEVTDEDVAVGVAKVRVVGGGDAEPALVAWASVVDNRTGDPTFVLPVPSIGGAGVVPAAASAGGLAGTRWASDLELHNPGSEVSRLRLAFLESRMPGLEPSWLDLSVNPQGSLRLVDVVGDTLAAGGSGALRLEVEEGEVQVVSRTFNSGDAGTYGQAIPGVPLPIEAGASQRLLHLDETAVSRSNLGLMDVSGQGSVVTVELFAADGSALGRLVETLGAWEHRQLNRVLRLVTDDEVAGAWAVVTPSPAGSAVAYASVVDAVTGDPVYVPGL